MCLCVFFFFFSSRRRHTRFDCDWSSDVCSSDLYAAYARQDFKAAIDHARTAVEQDPDNPQLQKLLTTTLAAGDRDQQGQALLRLDKSLSLTPNDPQLLMQRGYLYSRQEEPAKALQDFRAARATGEAPAGAMLDEGDRKSVV